MDEKRRSFQPGVKKWLGGGAKPKDVKGFGLGFVGLEGKEIVPIVLMKQTDIPNSSAASFLNHCHLTLL